MLYDEYFPMGNSVMNKFKALGIWLWRLWPIFAALSIAFVHIIVLRHFCDTAKVNKAVGSVLQVVGFIIVIYSVDSNLKLFKDLNLWEIVGAYFRDFPYLSRPPLNGAVNVTLSGVHVVAEGKVATIQTTIEERLAEVERQIQEIRSSTDLMRREVDIKIDKTKGELQAQISLTDGAVQKIREKVEISAVGGIKVQLFGALLMIHAAIASYFA